MKNPVAKFKFNSSVPHSIVVFPCTSMSDPRTPPIRSPPSAGGTPRIHRHGAHGLSARSKDQQQRFARDIEWKVLGPMPVDAFLEEFFPNPPDPEVEFLRLGIDSDEINFASVPNSPSNEEQMYDGLEV